MEQRSLRLGDIVDDYCPRERRVTNHAIVAVVGDSIRQTRCSTCDTEHEYKEAKVPKKRGKGDSDVADLSGGVLVTSKPAANGSTSDNGFENGTPEVAAAPKKESSSKSDAPTTQLKRLSYKQQQELAQLPAQIETLEREVADLTQRMGRADFYRQAGDEIAAAQQRLGELEQAVFRAYQRWEELDQHGGG